MKKMIILRGNSAETGTYPDENGTTIAWPIGALHVEAASDFARRKHYFPVVLPVPGQPQGESSPQSNAAVRMFLKDPDVHAFYGFSGGGYNVPHIVERLARQAPGELWRIELLVILGAPKVNPANLNPSRYDGRTKRAGAPPATWDVVYRKNPPPGHRVVPKGLDTHMFGPEWLLVETPAGRFRDVPLGVDD